MPDQVTPAIVERHGPVGLVTLNRPERHNAMLPETFAQLTAGLRELGTTPECRGCCWTARDARSAAVIL